MTGRSHPAREALRLRLPLDVIGVITATALLAGGAVSVAVGWGRPASWALWGLATAVAASETAVVHLAFGRQRWTFSCTDALIGAALVLAPGAWLVLGVAAGVAAAQRLRHQPGRKALFNVAQFSVAAAAAVAVTQLWDGHLPGGPWVAAGFGMGVFWLLNHVLVAAAVAMTSQHDFAALLWRSAPLSLVHTAGNTSVGLLAAWLALHQPLGLLGLLVPVVLLWSSYDQQTQRAAEVDLFTALAEGQEEAAGRSPDISARALAATATRVLAGADVELLVLGPEGPVRYTCAPGGPPELHRVGPEALDAPWALRALAGAETCVAAGGGLLQVSARVGTQTDPLAVVVARRPTAAGGPSRRELLLWRVLIRQATTWLSVAELTASRDAALEQVQAAGETTRALWDLGADTAPALMRLRESAGRLGRLANTAGAGTPAGGFTEIVAEMHAAERAVASLLGAMTLAAAAQLPSEGSSRSGEGEWTISGRLD